MFSVLIFSFNAVAPILILIALGYYARRIGMVDVPALKKINRFNFIFGFFSLMFVNLYTMEDLTHMPWREMFFLVAAFALLTLVGWLLTQVLTRDRRRKAPLIMAMFRSNYAIIGLMLASSLVGDRALELATMMQLPTVLYFNIVSTVILCLYGGTTPDLKKMARRLGTNPLILGILAGIIALLIRPHIPLNAAGAPVFILSRDLPWLYISLNHLARMSTPLALIVLGGQLELGEIAAFRRELAGGVAMRLALAPALGFAFAALAGQAGLITLNPSAYAMMTAAFGSPMAVASVVMSAEMGSDDQLCGQLVVWSSILGMVSIFLITSILRGMGLL